MARTAIPVNTFTGVAPAGLLDPAGTAIDQANGMNVALASGAIPAAPGARHLVLRVNNSAVAAHNVIVRAGASNPPAFRAGIGDLTVNVVNATTRWVGPLELARFVQPDGSINVDFDAGTTGTVTAFVVPSHTM